MAELSYDDVRRAAQDAVRELHGIVSGLRSNSEDIRRTVQQQQSNGPHPQLSDLNSKLNTLQNQISGLDSALRNQNNALYLLQNLQQNVTDLHKRLNVSEDFIRYMYSYISAQQAEREE